MASSPVSRLSSVADAEAMLAASQQQPVLVLKHSTACPVSAGAIAAFEAMDGDTPRYLAVVQTDRDVSDYLASTLDARHETPQAFLVDAGTAVWMASHGRIQKGALEAAVRDHAAL